MSTRFNLSPAKTPIDRPSGDQNTPSAPSVPATGCASISENGRSQSRDWPGASTATNASCEPSGDTANGTVSTVRRNAVPGGGATRNLTVFGTTLRPENRITANAAITATAATAHGNHGATRRPRLAMAGAVVEVCVP